jgi:hypothetical protein
MKTKTVQQNNGQNKGKPVTSILGMKEEEENFLSIYFEIQSSFRCLQ